MLVAAPTTRTSLLVVMAATATSVGCDPGYALHGSVTSEGAPVVSAQVEVKCDRPVGGGERTPIVTTRKDGSFDARGLGGLRRDCAVEVTAMGKVPARFKIADHCAKPSGWLYEEYC